jgi:type VI secretion system secreted protein VgrG
MPEKTQFRAERRAAWPRIYGTEHGVIDGEADSEYAQIDDHGRYAVRFAFDESDLKPGKASTWVRMLQPHGGGVEGWHFPLRKGTEVLFTFLGGDPDRPVIAGVVPNALTPSPVTRGNHTKNVIQTGGRNRLEFEDKAGQQRITLSTPYSNTYIRMGAPNADHELILHTADNALLDAKQNWDVIVGGNLDEHVIRDVKETYDQNKGEWVGGNTKETYKGKHTTTVGDLRTSDYGSQTTYVRGTVEETYDGALTRTFKSGATKTVIGDETNTITGSFNQHAGTKQHITLGTTSDTFIGLKNSNSLAANFTFTGGINVSVNASLNLSMSAALDIKFVAGFKAEYGAPLDLRVVPGVKNTSCVSYGLEVASNCTMLAGGEFTIAAPIVMIV